MDESDRDKLYYEKQCWHRGYRFVAGVDEVGRGPLAGPVVSAAVILPANSLSVEINDSKALSDKKRRELSAWIMKHAQAVGVGMSWQEEIDRINILNATLKAMSLAVGDLAVQPDFVLIDGNQPPPLKVPCQTIVHGDACSYSIAAASIVAKVVRDDLMISYDHIYPHYHFSRNKGYPTREHREALRKHGPCPLHRTSFRLL